MDSRKSIINFFIVIFLITLNLTVLISPLTIHAAQKDCTLEENRYRPDGDCLKNVPAVEATVDKYQKTCTDTPTVKFYEFKKTSNPNYVPAGAINFSGYGQKYDIEVSFNTDLTNARLGGFGPNDHTIKTSNLDTLSQIYPFNAFFDQPVQSSLAKDYRESSRTIWRLYSFYQQANLKAQYLKRVWKTKGFNLFFKNTINNMEFPYTLNGQEKTTDVISLYRDLPAALKRFPVSKNFVEKYQGLDPDTKAAYDALLPFNFDNVRGYMTLRDLNGDGSNIQVRILKENLPFIKAIFEGLNDSQTGLLNTLSPDSFNLSRAKNLVEEEISYVESGGSEIVKNYRDLIDQSKIIEPTNCTDHQNTIYLPAPKTYPDGLITASPVMEQTIIMPITTQREGPEEIIIIKEDGTIEITYEYTFTTQGEISAISKNQGPQPVTIFNNPKMEDVAKLLYQDDYSLFFTFTPSFVSLNQDNSPKSFDEKLIRDDSGTLSTTGLQASKTRILGKTLGTNRTPITRFENRAHITTCELRNKWLIPDELQDKNLDCENLEQSLYNRDETLPPPIDTDGINCDQSVPEQNISGFDKTKAQHYADIWFGSNCQGKNYFAECNNDVIKRSIDTEIDPVFAIIIWLHESAASNYICSAQTMHVPEDLIEDFGIHTAGNKRDFSDQLNRFVNLPGYYQNACSSDNLDNFVSMFWYGSCYSGLSTSEKNSVNEYVNYIKTTYKEFTGKDAPNWPK